MKILLFICSLCVTILAHAQETLPNGCKPLVIKGALISIPTDKPRIIMLHNLTKTDLWITHPVSDVSMSSGLSSRLAADRWSALMMNHSTFELSCIESTPGHEQQVKCKDVVSACERPTIHQQKQREIFWAAENMQLPQLIAYISRKGFMVP